MEDSDAQNSRLNDVSFTWFADKNLFTLATLINSQNDSLYASVATKNKDVGETLSLHKNDVQ